MHKTESAAEARVFKAGNSLAVRIPSVLAKRCNLVDGSTVDIGVEKGALYIKKSPRRDLGLLIEAITPENAHEVIFDDSQGGELW